MPVWRLWRRWWRRYWLALKVAHGARAGFFIPYRYAAHVPRGGRADVYPVAMAALADAWPRMATVLARIEALGPLLLRIDEAPVTPRPRWRQGWFPRLDAAAAYTLMHDDPPARLIEVGSGHSTRFMAAALARAGADTELITIDPAPRARIEGLRSRHIPRPVTEVDSALFAELRSGDVLFIDSSHILMPGTDVDHLFHRVLPTLPVGVRVHVHDIFLPDDYPATWFWRGYGEQLAVIGLLAGGHWAPFFSSHWVVSRHPDMLREGVLGSLPLLWPGIPETSLWLERVG